MNYEELAFVNQQLAGMLKSGIPLEGSLKQLCATMRRGQLRAELEALEADLAKGTPLRDALKARKLPEFYVHMLQVGAQANDLPGVLILLADYYSKANSLWTRLKGLMVYPLIVLVAAIAVSTLMANIVQSMMGGTHGFLSDFVDWGDLPWTLKPHVLRVNLFMPTAFLILVAVVLTLLMAVRRVRLWLRWKLPGFREASLAGFASAMSLLLRGGNDLSASLSITAEMEQGTPANADLKLWRHRLAQGHGTIPDMALSLGTLPPLFIWLVAGTSEDVASGFARAAEFYSARASHRIEMMLHAALPVSILTLGFIVIWEIFPIIGAFNLMTRPL